jgi:hypothetical protein
MTSVPNLLMMAGGRVCSASCSRAVLNSFLIERRAVSATGPGGQGDGRVGGSAAL